MKKAGLDIGNNESQSLFESEEDRTIYNDLPDTTKSPDVPTADDPKADGGTNGTETSSENAAPGETKIGVGASSTSGIFCY